MKYGYWLLCLATSFSFVGEIELRQIMDDPAWMGPIPEELLYSEADRAVYFDVRRPLPRRRERMRYDLKTGTTAPVDDAARPYALAKRSFSHKEVRIFEIEGDLWISRGKGPLQVLISRTEPLRFVRFLNKDRFVFRERQNLFLFSPGSGRTVQLTNLLFKDERKEKDDFYRSEERRLFAHVENLYQRDVLKEKREEEARRLGSLTRPAPIRLGKNFELGDTFFSGGDRYMVDVSPDLAFASVALAPTDSGSATEYARFITKEGDVRLTKSRSRVGIALGTWKLGIVSMEDGAIEWLDLAGLPEIETDRLAEIKAALPEADRKFLPKERKGPRPVRMVPGGFRPGGGEMLVTLYSRDFKDQWIILVDPETMEYTLAAHHHDPAWVKSYTRHFGTEPSVSTAAFWRSDGKKVMYLSEKTGYQHLYAYDPATGETNALTEGNFEVYSPFERGKHWYFNANKTHPGVLHFYRMPKNGGAWTALTIEPGRHEVTLSHDGGFFVELFSKTDRPPAMRIRKGKGPWKTVYDGRSDTFKAIDWMAPEVVTYRNRDGKDVYARLYKPERPNGAGVIFVHGAGFLQNAHKGWSEYDQEYLFHNLLVREGYTVLDPDYQASAGYGRDWRTAIYRHMGGKDLTDILDGAAFLADRHGVDPRRMGIYGGSYGGFITLMAMFTEPDVFRCGAALRPVSNWAYYNHFYTAQILNAPNTDPEAYRRSSPIYFADGLEGALLICHGMVDPNVYFQDSVRLAQKLIELGKSNWELAGYPVEPHSFRTSSSWYDEYHRIHELLQRNLGEP